MVYKQQNNTGVINRAKCDKCGCKRLLYRSGTLVCTDCDHVIGKRMNKYGAKRTTAKDGVKRDSKYEASVADELLLRKRAGDIKDYESQYKVECWAYTEDGQKAFVTKHKVDFRILHNDGSYELCEAKGVETADYKFRRKCLEKLWLPMHPDHTYTVVKQK